jgi:quinol monooxygenase YgiN
MAVTVTVRARLRGDPASAKQLHDQVIGATREMALAAGDIGHQGYLNPQDPMDFLGIDVWQSLEQFQAFAGSPQIAEFLGNLFEGEPEVRIWTPSGWQGW